MRICADIYMVGSGGHGLSHCTDAHLYLVDGGGELALIDGGSGVKSELIVANIAQDGFDPRQVKLLINTHSHWDHARGDRHIKELSGCAIAIHQAGVQVLEQTLWPTAVLSQRGVPSAPVKVDRALHNGEIVRVGRHALQVLHTPGHTPDSICLLGTFGGRRVLFSGDTLLGGGLPGVIGLQSDLPAYRASLDRLVAAAPEALFPGHYLFTLTHAQQSIEQLIRRFDARWIDFVPGPAPFLPSWWLINYPDVLEEGE